MLPISLSKNNERPHNTYDDEDAENYDDEDAEHYDDKDADAYDDPEAGDHDDADACTDVNYEARIGPCPPQHDSNSNLLYLLLLQYEHVTLPDDFPL